MLRGRPAQAFLKLLPLLQRGDSRGILEAYGEFYSSLAAGNYLSWQDYLLEEVSVLALVIQQRMSIPILAPASSFLRKGTEAVDCMLYLITSSETVCC